MRRNPRCSRRPLMRPAGECFPMKEFKPAVVPDAGAEASHSLSQGSSLPASRTGRGQRRNSRGSFEVCHSLRFGDHVAARYRRRFSLASSWWRPEGQAVFAVQVAVVSSAPTLALVTEIVHIDALLQKWLHRAVAGASPCDVVVRRRRVTPCPENEATVLCASMAEGGVPLADPANRPPKCSIATAANGEGTSAAKKSTSLVPDESEHRAGRWRSGQHGTLNAESKSISNPRLVSPVSLESARRCETSGQTG
jgi:hypothetical protein